MPASMGKSMSKLKHWCDEASVARWEVPAGAPLPDWPSCYRRMVTEGQLSPVLKPSPEQEAGLQAIPPPTVRPSYVPIQPLGQ